MKSEDRREFVPIHSGCCVIDVWAWRESDGGFLTVGMLGGNDDWYYRSVRGRWELLKCAIRGSAPTGNMELIERSEYEKFATKLKEMADFAFPKEES